MIGMDVQLPAWKRASGRSWGSELAIWELPPMNSSGGVDPVPSVSNTAMSQTVPGTTVPYGSQVAPVQRATAEVMLMPVPGT